MEEIFKEDFIDKYYSEQEELFEDEVRVWRVLKTDTL